MAAIALVVERILGKDEVTGSNPVSSTNHRSVAQWKSSGLRNQLSGVRISPDRPIISLSSSAQLNTFMFDKSQPNIVLLTDMTEVLTMSKIFGVHKIAYILRQAGYQVAVINHLSVFSIDEIVHLLENLVSDHTVFVGVNNFYYNSTEEFVYSPETGLALNAAEPGSFVPHGKKYNQMIKQAVHKINPKCKFVIGGPNVQDTDAFKDFDYLVLGYAEQSIVNLANHLRDGEPLQKSIRSLHGPVIVNDPKAEGYDFSQSSMCYEPHDVVLDQEVLYLEIGRGCIFNCSFCSYPLNGKKKLDYVRHKQLIIDELLDNYKKFNVTRYMIVDDTFNDSVEKCQMMYEISQALPFKIEYWAYIRLDLLAAKPETIDLLVNSGCRAMFFGIETFNLKTATAIRKGGSREKLIATIDYIKQQWGDRVSLFGSFILGLPYEDLDSINRTINFLESDDNHLDCWKVQCLRIKHPKYTGTLTNGFLSDLDRNYNKYGYQVLGLYDRAESANAVAKKIDSNMIWSNEYTNFYDMEALAVAVKNRCETDTKMGLNNTLAFELASLGINLDEILTVSHADLDWSKIDQIKLRRAVEYKKRLFEQLNIDHGSYIKQWSYDLIKHRTFTNYLMSRCVR